MVSFACIWFEALNNCITGLAFEKNSCKLHKRNQNAEDDSLDNDINPTISDIFFYSLHYIGVLTGRIKPILINDTNLQLHYTVGPYYKYKTYQDHLNQPFHKYDNYKTATLMKLFPLVPIYAAVYLFTDYMWPLSVRLQIVMYQMSY